MNSPGREPKLSELLSHETSVVDGDTESEGAEVGDVNNALFNLIDDELGALFTRVKIKLTQLTDVIALLGSAPRQPSQVSAIRDAVIVHRGE